MKNLTLVLGMSLMMTGLLILHPQTSQAQVKYGIKGGVNFANMKYEPKDQSNGVPDANSFTSYHFGFIVDIPVANMLSIQPGLMLQSVGTKAKYEGSGFEFTSKVNPIYIRVPVNILIKPELGPGSKFYIGAGPYIGYGYGGKISYEGELGGLSGYSDHDIEFGNDSGDDLKQIDIGGNVLAGIEFQGGLLLGVQYGMSFTNNAPGSDDNADEILKNKVLSVSIGYLF